MSTTPVTSYYSVLTNSSSTITGPIISKDSSFSQSNIIILCVLFTIGYIKYFELNLIFFPWVVDSKFNYILSNWWLLIIDDKTPTIMLCLLVWTNIFIKVNLVEDHLGFLEGYAFNPEIFYLWIKRMRWKSIRYINLKNTIVYFRI